MAKCDSIKLQFPRMKKWHNYEKIYLVFPSLPVIRLFFVGHFANWKCRNKIFRAAAKSDFVSIIYASNIELSYRYLNSLAFHISGKLKIIHSSQCKDFL